MSRSAADVKGLGKAMGDFRRGMDRHINGVGDDVKAARAKVDALQAQLAATTTEIAALRTAAAADTATQLAAASADIAAQKARLDSAISLPNAERYGRGGAQHCIRAIRSRSACSVDDERRSASRRVCDGGRRAQGHLGEAPRPG